MQYNREQALSLMHEWVKSDSLRKHMLCVEASMRAYAKKYGGDVEMWAIAGLLHDFDYEKYPEPNAEAKTGHPFEGVRHLESLNYPKEIITSILGHALYSGVKRETLMDKCLFAVDELCGFVVACAFMRPDHLQSLTAESVLKKLKDKKFAARVSREDIDLGVTELGVDKKEHIDFVILALKEIEKDLF